MYHRRSAWNTSVNARLRPPGADAPLRAALKRIRVPAQYLGEQAALLADFDQLDGVARDSGIDRADRRRTHLSLTVAIVNRVSALIERSVDAPGFREALIAARTESREAWAGRLDKAANETDRYLAYLDRTDPPDELAAAHAAIRDAIAAYMPIMRDYTAHVMNGDASGAEAAYNRLESLDPPLRKAWREISIVARDRHPRAAEAFTN
jgi:hypothetical protein